MSDVDLAQAARQKSRAWPIAMARRLTYRLLAPLFDRIEAALRAQAADIAALRADFDGLKSQTERTLAAFERRLQTDVELARERLAEIGPVELAALESSDMAALRNRLADLEDRLVGH